MACKLPLSQCSPANRLRQRQEINLVGVVMPDDCVKEAGGTPGNALRSNGCIMSDGQRASLLMGRLIITHYQLIPPGQAGARMRASGVCKRARERREERSIGFYIEKGVRGGATWGKKILGRREIGRASCRERV